MCGIAGYVGDVSREKILKMLQTTSYRGPDDSGIFVKGNVGLGNNRLAVIDLSPKGHQPMFDDEKSLCIVYNGEIYNFMGLRKRLEKEFKFRSNSDTEVIIYAYKKWGVGCLKHLNGMFAFVIYDMRKNLLFGARDRLGEKPLKYFYNGKDFIFASEVKGILPVLAEKPQIDLDAVNDFLTLSYVPAPKTGFKDIYKLPPASYFFFKDGKISIRKYWSLDFSKKLDLSESDWEDLLEEEIDRAVSERLVSDVPIGAFLSGGIDSSCVTAFMVKNTKSRIKTFNIGFRDSDFDETKYAKLVARKYHTDHYHINLGPKMFEDILIESVNFYDEPFADNSLVPSIYLSRFTRKNVTVALSGDGGDENFAGYDRYNVVAFGDWYGRLSKGFKSLIARVSNLTFKLLPNTFTFRLKTFTNTSSLPFYQQYLYYRSFFETEDKNKILKEKGLCDTFMVGKNIYNRKLSNLDNAMVADINSYLPEDLLFKMDIASMSASLEARAPLLDYKLMELTAKMPINLKIRNFNKKYIFKKMLLDKGILPKEIVDRPKRGFNPPYKKWFKENLSRYVIDTINSKKFRDKDLFDNKELDIYLRNYFNSSVDYSNNIFALTSLASWVNRYF